MWNYPDGTSIHVGDEVLVAKQYRARVRAILEQGSSAAVDYGCAETGGYLIEYRSGDVELVTESDPDVEKAESA